MVYRAWHLLFPTVLLLTSSSIAQSHQHRRAHQEQKLAFLTPNTIHTTSYSVGEQVGIRWTSPFTWTTLEVWQGPLDDGTFALKTLIANATSDMTMHTWTAAPLAIAIPLTVPFHLRLQKGDQPNLCPGCTAESLSFHLSPDPLPSADSEDTSSTSATLSKAGAVGVGVGVGVAAIAVALFIGLLLCIDKRYRPSNRKRRRVWDRDGGRRRHPLFSGSQYSNSRSTRRQLQRERKRQRRLHDPERQQSARSSWAESVATSSSGRPKSCVEPFGVEDLGGTMRTGWYELGRDGKWKQGDGNGGYEGGEKAHLKNEKSLDQSCFPSSSSAAVGSSSRTKVPECCEKSVPAADRYELDESEVRVTRPERVMRANRF